MSKVLLAKSITNIDLVKSIYGKSITRKSQMTQDAEDCDTDVKRRRCTSQLKREDDMIQFHLLALIQFTTF